MKNLNAAIVIVLFIAGSWLIYDNWDWINANFFHSYKEAPNFYLQDYFGKYRSLSEFKGTPMIINLWSADTPFSSDELRDFASLQQELGDKAIIIAVNRGEPLSFAKSFTDKLGITRSIVFLLDPKDLFYRAIGGIKTPETIFVDKKGFIVDRRHGPMKLNEMRQRVKRIL